ncbi:138R [Yaba monkey tumor virus]|uniref:Protein OPG181 n=1 Tax=Yaba monkey tumor virus (strain VR587) TaxID=928314 RepID=Q6TUN5_YMTV5|nr:138R [Yaba monkey tumor virus]AAR07491.1 138R [Yaba monkey tumor virus]
MHTVVGSVSSLKDIEALKYICDKFNNDDCLNEGLNVCKKLNNVVISTETKLKTLISDFSSIDKTISESYKTSFGRSLNRISRFCKIAKIDKKRDLLYIPKTKSVITAVLNINKSCTESSKCEVVITCNGNLKCVELENNNFVAIDVDSSSFFVKGKNISVLILMFDELIHPMIPLITSISIDDVLISRHDRLYNEIPNKNWFKFYVELKHEYVSSVTLIVDGTILHCSSDYNTHCFISKEIQNGVSSVNDDCGCCYSNSSVCVLSKNELLKKSVCESIRGGFTFTVLDVGNFSASFVGKYPNFDYLKITLSTLNHMISRKEKVSGKIVNGYRFYGICHK